MIREHQVWEEVYFCKLLNVIWCFSLNHKSAGFVEAFGNYETCNCFSEGFTEKCLMVISKLLV